MAALFFLNGGTPALKPGVKLVKAAEARPFLDALELSKRLAAYEAERQAQAEEAYLRRREEGYKDGEAAGREAYSLKIMETVMASVEYLENLESGLVKIVNDAVRKVIGELPPEEVVVKLARKALTSMRNDRRVTVRVSPRQEAAVRETLLGPAGGTPFLDVRADGRLGPGDCVLESELGVVDASLETQLRILAQALNSRVKG
ncbi:MAG: HrpE/YscL family type III secretion apparatus protein [Deltaproteobacteria bacterium]|jgi:type III secretion protein L|nr:HrpE/YscL family type III secretion apparatus protein [Deltaproteobacteria bacterium]